MVAPRADRSHLQSSDSAQLKAQFRTRVVTNDVNPSLNVLYKNARIKQYHTENRALRTETATNNTYDFGIRKRLHNLAALRTSDLQPTVG